MSRVAMVACGRDRQTAGRRTGCLLSQSNLAWENAWTERPLRGRGPPPRASATRGLPVNRPRLRSIVFDCSKPAAHERFWAAALSYHGRPYARARSRGGPAAGYAVEDDPSGGRNNPPGEGPSSSGSDRVPEPKAAKDRVHLDLNIGSLAEVDE